MRIEQVAAQLYTIRDYTKTAADLAASMKRLREIGYQAVQVSAIGPIEDAEVRRILDGEGLACCATHAAGQTIIDEPERVADQLDALGCSLVAFPHPGAIPLQTLKDVKSLAAKLDASGAKLRERGKTLTYHNHSLEFRRFSKRPMLEWFFRLTQPGNLQAELDTYWVQHGGGDPVAWCKKMKERLPILHMKDYAVGDDNQPRFAEIGNGNLDWRRIIRTAEKSGCKWFVVEQDTCPGDPFDSLKMSFQFLQKFIQKDEAGM